MRNLFYKRYKPLGSLFIDRFRDAASCGMFAITFLALRLQSQRILFLPLNGEQIAAAELPRQFQRESNFHGIEFIAVLFSDEEEIEL